MSAWCVRLVCAHRSHSAIGRISTIDIICDPWDDRSIAVTVAVCVDEMLADEASRRVELILQAGVCILELVEQGIGVRAHVWCTAGGVHRGVD